MTQSRIPPSRHVWESPLRPRLHVLHVSMPTTAGVAVVASRYVADQLDRRWNVTVACPSDGWLGFTVRDLGARVRWWSANRDFGPSALPEAVSLSRIVREVAPDVVHVHSAKAGLVGRLAVRGSVPTVYQPHGWSFLAARGPVRAGAERWERLATRWTDELVCVSEDELALGCSLGLRGSASVIPNGVDLSQWPAPDDEARAQARRALELDESPLAVCVGRLAEQKGQHDLLDAWPAVLGSVPSARLVLVGDGPDRDELGRRAAGLEGVTMVGDRTDVSLWMAAANVVVVPSRWEGMALVPLEAMASERAVVAADVIGIAESVPPEAGAVLDARDPARLAEAVAQRLDGADGLARADQEGLVGRHHVLESHDAASSAETLAQTYLRLLAGRRRSTR